MAFGKVTVRGPANRDVFVNKLRSIARGRIGADGVSEAPIAVEFGDHLFETLDKDRKPDFRGTAIVDEQTPKATVELKKIRRTAANAKPGGA